MSGPEQSPITLDQSSVMLHEMFLSLQQAGFTEAQALHLVAQMLRPKPEGE